VLKPGGHFLYADLHDPQTVGEWRSKLEASGLTVLVQAEITKNVLHALDADNERKLALIERLVPSVLRPAFLDFAGMRGSKVYKAFQSGSLVYFSFVTRKSA
jgi:hypothetical protein